MSKILELTKDGWRIEIQSSQLPERTRELLTKAILARTTNGRQNPRISIEEFDKIIINHVFFVRLGKVGLILNKSGKGGDLRLFLQEEKEEKK